MSKCSVISESPHALQQNLHKYKSPSKESKRNEISEIEKRKC